MRRPLFSLVLTIQVSAVVACSLSGTPPSPDALQTSVAATLTQAAPAPTATDEPTPTASPLPARLWKPYSSSGSSAWWLENGTAGRVVLPVDPGQYYDYSPANRKILYASHFASAGAGPSNLAASDLWMVDYPGGTPAVLIPDDRVVEALWTPDGRGFVFILATPTTYELRYRSLGGEDRLLASDVSPTWSVSPRGDLAAFTRETGYNLAGAPGLYVVSTTGGPEWMISDADRRGAGSIDDRPTWSADGSWIALPNYGSAPGALVLASSDGTIRGTLSFAGDLAADPSIASVPLGVLWHPDGRQLVGVANYSDSMGGPSPLYLYRLGPDGTTVTGAVLLGDGFGLIDWNVPGVSFYYVNQDSDVGLMTLP